MAYETESSVTANEIVNTFDCNYHGGLAGAIGLCEMVKQELMDGIHSDPRSEEEAEG